MHRCSCRRRRPDGQHYLVSEPKRSLLSEPDRPGMYSRLPFGFFPGLSRLTLPTLVQTVGPGGRRLLQGRGCCLCLPEAEGRRCG